jgi:pyruvate dehydrogenase E2 component (dihydrolipoamide acetyltransferase)
MPIMLTMPKLSPTMQEGTIVKWHKKVQDKVSAGDVLIEVATDKATVEYNALDDGYLRKILVQEGQSAVINQPIAIMTETADENIEGVQVMPVKTEKKAASPTTEPAVQALQEPSPQKAAPVMQQPAIPPEAPLTNYQFPFPGKSLGRVRASPLAKKLAQEKGLDLSTVKGSGPQGRVVKEDLDLAQSNQVVAFGRREVPDVAPGTYEEIPLSPMRKAIGERLQYSKSFIPHFYIRQEINADALVETFKQLKECGLKISYNDFVVKAAALALREHPIVNSGFNAVNQTIIHFQTIDISIAVAIEGGLITPIVRHADYKNLGEIAVEIKELAERAKAGKLEPEEYKGGSFTISNLGMMGISEFTAVINPPQSAILAVAGIEDCVRMKNGVVVAGKRMSLVLSVDHRSVDGLEAAKFMKTLQKFLENPAILLI